MFMCVVFNFANGSSLCNCGLHLQFSPTFQAQIRDPTELLFKGHVKCGIPIFLKSFQYVLVLYLTKWISK